MKRAIKYVITKIKAEYKFLGPCLNKRVFIYIYIIISLNLTIQQEDVKKLIIQRDTKWI